MQLPALQARTFDLPRIAQAGAQVRGQNALTRYHEARTAAIPQEARAQVIEARRRMSAEERARDDRAIEQMVRSIAYIEGLPELARPGAYAKEIERLGAAGVDTSQIPQQYSPEALARGKAQAADMGKLFEEADTQKPPSGYRWTESDNLEAIPGGPGAEKPLAIERKMKLAGIDPDSDEGKAIVEADLMGQQISIETDPDGTTRVSVGKGAGPGLEKKTRGNLEAELFKAKEGLARLETIAAGFRPEYQQFETRFGTAWTAFKEKYGSLPGVPEEVPQQDREVLADYTAYRRDAIDNLNRYIKDMTGAAMSLPEAERIRKGVPDAGEGIFDGDSPTQFQAKLIGTMASLKKATARYAYALRNGLKWKDIGLDEIEGIMRRRMTEIEQEVRVRNPNIGSDALGRLLNQTLGIEFGLLGPE